MGVINRAISFLLTALSPADALSSSSSEVGSSAKDAATGLKDKAKAALKDATSALPNTTSEVADVPFFRGRKDSFKSDAEKDPNAGVCVCAYVTALGQ